MALGRKKLDDKILKTLRELVSIGGNKECFDCGQKGPTYINMTIGSFVCTSCSGILRGLTPPHRVKSISMATFTQDEIEFLKLNGNENCNRTWLGLWDAKRTIKQEHRDFMIDKYERKRYYLEPASPLKSLQTNASSSLSSLSMKNVNESMVPLKTPTQTPPTTLRLHRNNSSSCNGLNSVIPSATSTGSEHRNGSASQFQQQFTPDDSDFFGMGSPKILPLTPQNHSNLQRKNGIKIKKPITDQTPTFERNQKNGLLSTSTSSNGNIAGEYSGSNGDINANKFTPNSDFVADFGSTSIVNNIRNDKNHYGSVNNLKDSGTPGVENENKHPHHGKSSDDDLENFADFDHNPIFNSAENMKLYSSFNSIDSSTTTNSVSSMTGMKSLSAPNPFVDFYLLGQTEFSRGSHNASINDKTSDPPDLALGIISKRHAAKYTCMSPIDDSIQSSRETLYEFGKKYNFNDTSHSLHKYINDQPVDKFRTMNAGTDSNAFHNINNNNKDDNNNNNNNDSSTSNNNNCAPFDNIQWSIRQHFQSHSSSGCTRRYQEQQQHNVNNNIVTQAITAEHIDSQINFFPNQNQWSLPQSQAIFKTSSYSTNNNVSVSTAPSVDRYAALKDLDEQFREFKLDADSNNMSTTSNGLTNLDDISDHHAQCTVNPFKPINPFQQREQHEQRQGLNWSVGVAGGIPYHTLGNGYPVAGAAGTIMSSTYNTTSSNGGQPLVSNMSSQNFGNPFMVTGTGSSNNPFL
ncbi:arf-GAP domain and FG repeat-containing protein 1-like isoform X2 [Anopheles albimanus]|uniref:arf-GAP domain and FG repeat-containing protein 1-like isoform X2 n=1 Tax=Anopheles albimanus TaxID=7167 RepID=UPI00164014CF|nr:arf-GAP domain and FG repeat-containing protein 1-like isoform X2 [Anopheles albimanus]